MPNEKVSVLFSDFLQKLTLCLHYSKLSLPGILRQNGICCLGSSDEEDLELVVTVLALQSEKSHRKKKVKKKRSTCTWVRPWIQRRGDHGAYKTLLKELAAEDTPTYNSFLRMDLCHFEELSYLVTPIIKRQDTNMREAIPPGERLALTLRFLASGDKFRNLQYLYRIPPCTISRIVHETCPAIYEVLKQKYLQFPYYLGAIDGKHIALKAPPGEDSAFYNYKNFHSIILLALVDSSYKFVYVDIGANGRAEDAGVFRDSPLFKGMENGTFHIPRAKPLPGTATPAPYVIVADDAFPLKNYLLKPYPERHDLPQDDKDKRRVFDYRLSRTRRCAENAFGILIQRFAIFQTTMSLSPEKATNVTLAALALHNFLMKEMDMAYSSGLDQPPHSLRGLQNQGGNRSAINDARTVRDVFTNYFNDIGSVPWQFNLPQRK